MVNVASESIKAAIVARHVRLKLPSHKSSEQFGIGARTIRNFFKTLRIGYTIMAQMGDRQVLMLLVKTR